MVLEATMILVDNSESSRNGDYIPSRWEAQTDLTNLIFNTKTNANPESSVGLMSYGGSGPEVLSTLTTNPGAILEGLHRTKVRGNAHFSTGVQIASLALKHRQNKSQRQRIVVMVCSPLEEKKEVLVKLGKRMRKNNTSIDVVAFGDLTDENVEKLQAFNEALQGGDGSHLEIVPPGPNLLSDTVIASPILAGEGGAPAADTNGDAGGAGGDHEFGVDPNLDPELALVLRMSMEEERERQAREQRAREEAEGKTNLEPVAEEGSQNESAPLLGESSSSAPQDEKKDKDGEGGDRMDTA